MSEDQTPAVCSLAKIALETSPVTSMRTLCVEQVGDSLVLSGRVPTFYQKQMAQEIIRGVAADCEVVNSIDVD